MREFFPSELAASMTDKPSAELRSLVDKGYIEPHHTHKPKGVGKKSKHFYTPLNIFQALLDSKLRMIKMIPQMSGLVVKSIGTLWGEHLSHVIINNDNNLVGDLVIANGTIISYVERSGLFCWGRDNRLPPIIISNGEFRLSGDYEESNILRSYDNICCLLNLYKLLNRTVDLCLNPYRLT